MAMVGYIYICIVRCMSSVAHARAYEHHTRVLIGNGSHYFHAVSCPLSHDPGAG